MSVLKPPVWGILLGWPRQPTPGGTVPAKAGAHWVGEDPLRRGERFLAQSYEERIDRVREQVPGAEELVGMATGSGSARGGAPFTQLSSAEFCAECAFRGSSHCLIAYLA